MILRQIVVGSEEGKDMEYQIANVNDVVGEAIDAIVRTFRSSPLSKTEGQKTLRYIVIDDKATSAMAEDLNGGDSDQNRVVVEITLGVLNQKRAVTSKGGYFWFDEAAKVTFT